MNRFHPAQRRRRPGLALPLALAACMGDPAGGIGPGPAESGATRFTLQVEPDVDRIALVGARGPACRAQPADAALAATCRNRFGQARCASPFCAIETPSGDDPVSAEFAWRVKAALEAMGAPVGETIQVVAYAAPDPRAPVVVGFETVRASGAAVRDLLGQSSPAPTGNDTSANFGCAVTANLAAQIADPRDIVTPRGMTPVGHRPTRRRLRQLPQGRSHRGPSRSTSLANRRVSQAVN
jgi:pilus assembly protein CpaD